MGIPEKRERIFDILRDLRDVSGLTDLFCSELNYEYRKQGLSTRNWADKAAGLAKQTNLIARHDDFRIIYCQVEKLLLGTERPIVNQIIKEHPYFLVIFSTPETRDWHFVNVKYDQEAKNRRVFRRIVIGPDERLRTAVERVSMLDIRDESISPLALQEVHDEAFDVEKVTEKFYKCYDGILNYMTGKIRGRESERDARHFSLQLLNRLMFLYFIQRKRWLKGLDGSPDGDREFMKNLWEFYQDNKSRPDTFYSHYLIPLFFEAFRKRFGFQNMDLPQPLKRAYTQMPYLNGGLFQKNNLDQKDFRVPDEMFKRLFNDLLEHYNFTVREDTPFDQEVALDHEMLGKVYETFIHKAERSVAGIFYTPRTEVDFMCRRSLIEYFASFNLLPREDIIRLVMEAHYPETIPEIPPETLQKIKEKLEEVRVVDPACGSGAFLVGMLRVLVGLHRYIAEKCGESLNEFNLKKRIIANNLHGVDIMDWAVRIAELRLWLTLMVETEEEPIDLHSRPLLPNLTFKVRQGDSLVEEIEGQSFSLRRDYAHIPRPLKRKISEIVKKKQKHYNEGVLKYEIERLEEDLFIGVLTDIVRKIDKKIKRLRSARQDFLVRDSDRRRIFKDDEKRKHERRNAEIRKLVVDKDRVKRLSTSWKSRGKMNYFFWDIDFAEVFEEKGGFDIVIANPPFVRQEEIAPANLQREDYADRLDEWREIKRDYKEKLIRSVETHWDLSKINRRCDLYVYFYLHGLALLRPGGIFSFITSNSWLDVGYGATLQEFLLDNIEIKGIYDNKMKKSFESHVNTIITLFVRPGGKRDLGGHTARFVMFQKPFEAVLRSENLIHIEEARERTTTEDFRVVPIAQSRLREKGLEIPKEKRESEVFAVDYLKYGGGKWGAKYLRAPDIFFTILEKGKGKLVRLGDIAEIRRGFTTGCNEFFYLPSKHFDIKKEGRFYKLIPKHEGLPDDIRIEQDYLKPVVKSPRECKGIIVNVDNLRHKVFMCQTPKQELNATAALKYIEWGEKSKFNNSPTVRNRTYWWNLGERRISQALCMMSYNDRHIFWKNTGYLVDARFYDIYFDGEVNKLITSLNSCISFLSVELHGRVNLGLGALDFKVYEAEDILIISPNAIEGEFIIGRPIKSVFEELGVNRKEPTQKQKPNPLPDRKSLDDIVFDILGLTQAERDEVYLATCELVKARLQKARSVSRRK